MGTRIYRDFESNWQFSVHLHATFDGKEFKNIVKVLEGVVPQFGYIV